MGQRMWNRWKIVLVVLFLVGFGAVPVPAAGLEPLVVEQVDLPKEMGRPLSENTLKLFRAAVDPAARRLYVSGILTPHLAVRDLESGRWIATIDSGLPKGYKYLSTDEVNHLLFIRDGSNGILLRVDPRSGTVGPSIQVPTRSGAVLCDGARGLVYLLTAEAPSLRAYREDTLELAWTSSEMGTGIGKLALDPGTGELLLLDVGRQGPGGRIYRFDPDVREVTGTITFDLPAGARAGGLLFDTVRQRLLITVGSRELRSLGMDGKALATFPIPGNMELQAVALDPGRDRLLVVTVERPQGEAVSGIGGHLLVLRPGTMELERDMTFGRKLRSLALDAATGYAWLPNGDAGTVWRANPGTGEVTGLRLGDSAEQLLPVDGGRTLILNSRLGGSYLMAWDVDRRRVETFETGTWPIPMRWLPDPGLLLVLNAWDGTLSVLEPADLQRPLATIRLDLPPGTTDRLPDLAVDPARRLAFAAYPEYGAIAVVDLVTFSAAGVLHVPGAVTGDTGGGPGQLVVGVDSSADRLLAVEPMRGRVTVFSIDGGQVLSSGHFSNADVGSATTDMLFVDEEQHACWVGRLELSTLDGSPTGRRLPRGDRIFAVDRDRGLYWAAGVEEGSGRLDDVLMALDRETLAVAGAWDLGPADALHSAFAFVPPTRIWRTRMTTVDLFGYDIRRGARKPVGRVSPAGQARTLTGVVQVPVNPAGWPHPRTSRSAEGGRFVVMPGRREKPSGKPKIPGGTGIADCS